MSPNLTEQLEQLRKSLEGDLFTDESFRLLHATDASEAANRAPGNA